MKIAFIGQKGIPAIYGGIERHVEELSARLAKCGFEVSVYCRPWYNKKQISKKANKQISKFYRGVKLIYLPSLKTKHLDAISHTLFATLHSLFCNYDIIHYHGVGPSLLSWIPRIFKPKTKIVTTFHCIDRKHQKWGVFARLMLRAGEWAACSFAHETITVSKTLQQYCAEAYDKETVYIPNGVDAEKSKIPPSLKFRRAGASSAFAKSSAGRQKSKILESYNLEKNKYLLMVSRLVKHKGAHYLIEAFQKIKNGKKFNDLKLVIAGDSSFTDDYVKSLKKMAGERQDIIFVGFQTGKPLEDLFLNALVVVHPSESEGLPIAVLEAMSYGKVVLASDIPENMELVKNYGFRFQNKNTNDLTRQLKNLIGRNDLGQKGKAARDFVIKNYNWDKVAVDVKRLYLAVGA